jgi:hypothetical protein
MVSRPSTTRTLTSIVWVQDRHTMRRSLMSLT